MKKEAENPRRRPLPETLQKIKKKFIIKKERGRGRILD